VAARRELPDIMGEALGRLTRGESQAPAKVLNLPSGAAAPAGFLGEKLAKLRLKGMAEALKEQTGDPSLSSLSFTERLDHMVELEISARENRRLKTRLKKAGLRFTATLADVDYNHPRGLDKVLMERLSTGGWIREHANLLITGPTGIGKTYLACALAHQACLLGFPAGYQRVPQLLPELTYARRNGTLPRALAELAKFDPLILDDWGLEALDEQQGLGLLELFEERCGRRSCLVVGQDPVESWSLRFADQGVAQAVLDRLVHNAIRVEIQGRSLRKTYAKTQNITIS